MRSLFIEPWEGGDGPGQGKGLGSLEQPESGLVCLSGLPGLSGLGLEERRFSSCQILLGG